MPNLQDIRRRILSVKNTQKITRAMKMVAAAKLRRAQEAVVRARPYANRLAEVTRQVLVHADPEEHPLLHTHGDERIAIVVVTADRGLCGGFNSTIVLETLRLLREDFAGKKVELTIVGRKGADVLKRRACTIRRTHTGVFEKHAHNAPQHIVDGVVEDYLKGEVDAVYCIYNEFKSAVAQKITLEKLLPYEPPAVGSPEDVEYLYEPNEEAILTDVIVLNLEVQMHRVLLESTASEHGARMRAMDAATNNARDVIASLTLRYNRVRQDAITKEVVEVVSGAEAL